MCDPPRPSRTDCCSSAKAAPCYKKVRQWTQAALMACGVPERFPHFAYPETRVVKPFSSFPPNRYNVTTRGKSLCRLPPNVLAVGTPIVVDRDTADSLGCGPRVDRRERVWRLGYTMADSRVKRLSMSGACARL